ncbi:MAG: solute:sodium symporter family transporter [Bacteroidia bacterium]|nr:solute:sodium symporter family transporter [Bacteroidia bacterium]
MEFSVLDIVAFVGFMLLVIGVSLWAGRKEETSEDYFLAGRKLSWWLIGLSLIASNISSEHFIGMSGQGFGLGLAIASYEWMAAITLIIVALFFLPRFLKAGIYTIPEFLELRYNHTARTIMAGFMILFYIFVTMATVLYSGALALKTIFDINIICGIWLIGLLAGAYTVYGGLKAVVWSDLIQGSTLLIVGLVVMFLGFEKIGGWEAFVASSADKLHTVLPADHPDMPWVAVFIGGLWIPNIFYWGLNQFITQRTLGAKSLNQGQTGILFGATLKLIIPFIVVFPGIMAFELYGSEIANPDEAYPYLLTRLLPKGLMGIMFAALFGAVMSTLDSLLNSAATIFTIDIYKRYLKKDSTSKQLVNMGRISTLVLVVFGCLWAPIVGSFDEGVYVYIQKFWGFIQSGVVAAFIFGILWKKVPAKAAVGAMLLNIPVYGALLWFAPDEPFLNHMGITFLTVSAFITVYTLIWPQKVPTVLPAYQEFDSKPKMTVIIWSVLVFLATAGLYIYFA